jgi:tight adherence protein B
MRTALILFLSLALVGLVEAVFQFYRYLSDRRLGELRKRLNVSAGPLQLDSQLLRQGRFAAIPALDAWLSTHWWARRIEHLLEQADSRITVAQFLGFSALGSGVGALSALWVGLLPGIGLTAVGALAPRFVLVGLRRRRSRKLTEQLPEALDMMARSLRAGHGLSAAFELVATEMPEPVAVEFGRAFEEQRLGMALDRVVLEMAARAPDNGDLKIFAVSAVIQKETGGNLAEILGGIASTIRDRYRFFGKLRALTAEARSSAWFVSLMPVAMFLFLALTQPGYVKPLFEVALGRAMFAFGIGVWILGVVWFARLTKFRY